jgi:hypothetical protein
VVAECVRCEDIQTLERQLHLAMPFDLVRADLKKPNHCSLPALGCAFATAHWSLIQS